MINTELFQKVFDQIDQHRETHDQGSFENYGEEGCNTTRCVAGWAVAFHYGAKRSIYEDGLHMLDHRDREVPERDGYLSSTAAAAADILGIPDEQAYDLFYEMSDERAVETCLRYATKGDEA